MEDFTTAAGEVVVDRKQWSTRSTGWRRVPLKTHRELILVALMGASPASPALPQLLPEASELRSDVAELPPIEIESPTRTVDEDASKERSLNPKPSVFRIAEGPPAGFESLMEPQRTLVDVSYGGIELEPALATFSPGRFRFEDAAAVVAQIPYVKAPSDVTRALTGRLHPHADRICRRRGVPRGCGRLLPTMAGVIFDADRFAAEVFVHPRLLDVPALELPSYLPPPMDELSAVASLSGSYSGTTPGPDDYDFRTDALIAYGPRHLRAAGGVATDGKSHLEELVGVMNWPDYEGVGGLFRTQPLRALGDREIAGARFGTSLKMRTRLWLDRAFATPIQVLLTRRSRVDLRRDGRLLTSAVYDAGNQEIDVSALPEGAYDVEVLVRDPVSGDRSELHFFSRSADLAPRGEPLYHAEVGALRSRRRLGRGLNYRDGPFAHVGGAVRHTDRIGYDADLALVDRDVVFGLGAFFMERGVNVRAGPIATHRGAAGMEFLSSASRWGAWANLNARGLWGNVDRDSLTNPYTDISGSMGKTVGPLRLQVASTWRRTEFEASTESSYSVTPSIRWPFLRRSWMRGDLQFDFSQTDRGQTYWLRIDLAQWTRSWFFSESAGVRHNALDEDSATSFEGELRGTWHDLERWAGDARITGIGTSHETRSSIGARGDYRGPPGGASLYTEHVWHDDQSDETLYGGTFAVGLVGHRDGLTAGGTGEGRSAVIVDLRGAPEGANFEVFTGSVRRAIVVVGQPSLLFLPPYESYEVRIVPRTQHLTVYDTANRRVTLFPGTTSRLVWEIEQVFILVTSIVLPDGAPVRKARVKGTVGPAATDEHGILQADVRGGSDLEVHFGETGTGFCRVRVPEPLPDQPVIVADQLTCR